MTTGQPEAGSARALSRFILLTAHSSALVRQEARLAQGMAFAMMVQPAPACARVEPRSTRLTALNNVLPQSAQRPVLATEILPSETKAVTMALPEAGSARVLSRFILLTAHSSALECLSQARRRVPGMERVTMGLPVRERARVRACG